MLLMDKAWSRLLREKHQDFFVAIPSATMPTKVLPTHEAIHNAMARKIFYSAQ